MKKGWVFAAVLLTFQTTAQVIIYSEDFQSGLPANYTVVDNDGLTPAAAVSEYTSAWITIADPDNSADSVMASTSYFDPEGTADRWLITPAIMVGAFGNIAYWEARSHDPSFPDTYYVLVSGTDNQLSSFTDTLYSIGGENPEWTSRSGNLSDLGYNSQIIYLAFVNRTEDGFKLYIDDIRIEQEDPSGLDEISAVHVQVYPNPVQNELRIQGINDVESFTVFSMDGTQVLSGNGSVADVRSLHTGTYLLRVTGEGKTGYCRFIHY